MVERGRKEGRLCQIERVRGGRKGGEADPILIANVQREREKGACFGLVFGLWYMMWDSKTCIRICDF